VIDLIALIFLICGISGITIIVLRKIPLLSELPEIASGFFNWKEFFSKIKTPGFVEIFSDEILLQKVLSKIRILTLKTEHKTSNWLQKLRERSLKKKSGDSDKYWDDIRSNNPPGDSKQ